MKFIKLNSASGVIYIRKDLISWFEAYVLPNTEEGKKFLEKFGSMKTSVGVGECGEGKGFNVLCEEAPEIVLMLLED